MREVRISPDGNTVAIRSDSPEEAWNAWFLGNAANLTSPGAGGHWDSGDNVIGWSVLQHGTN